jgi:hypothetical protein
MLALSQFDRIDLGTLNARADMMTRRDRKYVLTSGQLAGLQSALADHFDVLEIAGNRRFGYHSWYFDTPCLRSFRDHAQGRRRRAKIRTRAYLDSGLAYVEVKHKGARGQTVKSRLPYHPGTLGLLDAAALGHVGTTLGAAYGPWDMPPLSAVLWNGYTRITLVAREGRERMTIDGALVFRDGWTERCADPDCFVLETKSEFGRGLADRLLRGQGLHPVGSCSKYCTGLAALGRTDRHNRFLPAMTRLGLAGPDRTPYAIRRAA